MTEQVAAQAQVTPEELAAAFEGPAVFCNKMYVTMTPVTGRLAFMEVPPGGTTPIFRTAVAMTVADLLELRALLNKLLEGQTTTITHPAAGQSNG